MIKIGEKLNSSIPKTLEALRGDNTEYLIDLIKTQSAAGADYLDVNTALCDDELEKMLLLTGLIKTHSGCGIMLDSPSPEVIRRALLEQSGSQLILNSVTLTERLSELAPLAAEYGTGIVAMPIDDNGIPQSAAQRAANSVLLIEKLLEYGIKCEKIFVDVIVQALSVDTESAVETLNTISLVKEQYPNVKTVCGLSNISFGLPKRININSAFLTMAISRGLDSAIMDVVSPAMQTAARSAEALCGRDEYCIEYISHIRSTEKL